MLSVGILNYNGKDIIGRAVDSVLKQSHKPDEIIVVDNQSTDESWKIIEKDVSRVIHADNQHKFITGLNTVFKQASEDVIMFMENDVVLHRDCIREMILPHNRIVSPAFYHPVTGKKFAVEWYSGFLSACFMMSKSTFEFIGDFDTNLAPAYWEDVDYSIRARRMGFECRKDVGRAIHYANWSFSKVFTKPQMSGWCRRNAWYVLKKHYL